MAQPVAASLSALRAITFRISSTPPKRLPNVASQIAATIWNSRDLLSAPSDGKQNNDVSTAVHRFKTQLSSLLQDRSVEGRWSAIVLVKATIEAGGVDVLSKSNPWVRSLLGILKKPDPPTTRNLACITLTRIFMLTWDYSSLVREITTPALTTFVPICLANTENPRCTASELQTILETFAVLLPRHPTIFRTNESRLRTCLQSIISSTSSESDSGLHYTQPQISIASRLWALLHTCAPKQGASEKWDQMIREAIRAAHATCDRVFRSVHEAWQTVADVEPSLPSHVLIAGDLELSENDAAGLQPWKGIHAGGERLVSLLQLVESHIAASTPSAVAVRIGLIADLLARLFAVTAGQPGALNLVKNNNQVSKDEREAMLTILPEIHTAAIKLVIVLLERFDTQAFSWLQSLFDQALYVFRAEQTYPEVRSVLYQLFTLMIHLGGSSLSKNDVAELDPVLRTCCRDLLPVDEGVHISSLRIKNPAGGAEKQTGIAGLPSAQSQSTDFSALKQTARLLVCTALSRVESSHISPKLRGQIDRTGVLTRDKDILLASVLEPPRKQTGSHAQASLLPILAREFSQGTETEALLRPRMPPIYSQTRVMFGEALQEPEDDVTNQDMMQDIEKQESTVVSDWMDTAGQGAAFDAQFQSTAEDGKRAKGKRRALEDVKTTSFAKRVRASSVAESLLSDSIHILPGSSPSITVTNGPEVETTSALESNVLAEATADLDEHIRIESRESTPAGATQSDAHGIGQEGSDDSDFELPPLTMEPDTDPEDGE